MISQNTWSLDPKVLDAYVRTLRTVVSNGHLREYEAVLFPDGAVDAHASAFARAYRVKGANGLFACLRFWLTTDPAPILETYAALERAPEVLTRCGLSQVQLFTEAITVDGKAIPAILMDWVEGSALGDAVNTHLGDSIELRRIAEALRSTFVSLNDHRTSHGDLRASNILTTIDSKSVGVVLIDLDSLRWYGGPTCSRVMGGNKMWDDIRQRDHVSLLESDYLDQAMTYLTVAAVAAERRWWPGPTDGFLTFKHLRADSKEILVRLEQMNGTPAARVAGAVRRVIEKTGHWTEVADVMQNPMGGPLKAARFWDIANERRDPRTKTVRKAPQLPATKPEPTKVPPLVSNVPSHPANRMPPWLWILVVITMAVIVTVVYWLKQP